MLASGTTVQTDGADYARQRITISLDVFLGEWFLDLRIGLPYFRSILVHSPNSDTVRTVIKAAIMNTPGIVSVPTLTVDLDTTARIAHVVFIAIYEDGTEISQPLDLVI